jgi:uncharacterized membrane protein YfcA
MPISVLDIVLLCVISAAAGTLGGLLGIGGSVIIVPCLVVLTMGREWHSQHLFQASAMIINLVISVPAALKHRANGAVRVELFRIVLPSMLVAIIAGVLVSNLIDGATLRRYFGAFLLILAITESMRFLPARNRQAESTPAEPIITVLRGGTVGVVMGFVAGLLGIGGGLIAVPLSQRLCRVPLRQAIGVSAAVMAISASIGSFLKVSTLVQHGDSPKMALLLAALLAPGAFFGARYGASLTHRAPTTAVRGVFLVVLVIAGLRMVFG